MMLCFVFLYCESGVHSAVVDDVFGGGKSEEGEGENAARRRRSRALVAWSTQDGFAEGVEAMGPISHIGHQLLRRLQLPIPTEDGVDKGAAAAATEGGRLLAAVLALRRFPHVILARA